MVTQSFLVAPFLLDDTGMCTIIPYRLADLLAVGVGPIWYRAAVSTRRTAGCERK